MQATCCEVHVNQSHCLEPRTEAAGVRGIARSTASSFDKFALRLILRQLLSVRVDRATNTPTLCSQA
jgi:hypothetical protein